MEDTHMTEGSQRLFDDLTFTIVPNGLSEDRQRHLTEDLTAAGGIIIPFDTSSGHIDKLEEIKYIISSTTDFPDYHQSLDLMIHVVKPAWVDASLHINKLKNPRSYSPDPQLFMSEVVICCGNIPQGDKEAIEGGVIAMGGQCSASLSKQVTHLIALTIDDPRCQLAIAKKLQILIVLPHWFDDCLRVGRRISERPYMLPDPEYLNVEAGAIPAIRASAQIRNATNPEPADGSLPSTPPAHLQAPRAIRAFEGKKVKLGEDLNLSENLKGVITDLIAAGGGEVTLDLQEAHMYVCNYRDGADYVKASQDNKDVGNLSWLYYLITHDTWTSPMRRLLHYPRPRDGISENFRKYTISISSYTGEARVYLENLVKASGAEFTKTFKQDNTHLIAAHENSEKCSAAKEWGVHIVNHLWLEESYAFCKEQTLTDPRYTHFPSRTNLGEILGQTEINRAAVEKMFFSKTRKVQPPKPAPQPNLPASSAAVSKAQEEPTTHMSPPAEKKKRGKKVDDVATPLPARHVDGKENVTPGTAGSRGAKDRALSKLHDAAPDIAKFEKEMKRKGGVIHGGRRPKEDDTEEKGKKTKARESISSKRSADEMDLDESEDEISSDTAPKNKKAKKDKLGPIKYRMLVTKLDRWTNNPDQESKDKAKLRELGVFITDDFKKVDFLCAPKAVRTKKFVAALACGPTLVSSSYLDNALKNNKLPPAEKHLLQDKAFEKANGFLLEESVARAKKNQHRLLKDWTIFCTDAVAGGPEVYKDIVVANGGKCQAWRGRTTNVTASKRSINTDNPESQNQEEDEGDVLYLISDAKKSEVQHWVKFRELAKKHDMTPRIVRTDWLLSVAMAQYVHWDPKWELNEEVLESG
ncbi:BRCT domain-containing protein [Corynespora cassiicola Philippines]|uniref:BRCT domain-containing protein n=1 Tax=Corynespora cassiicola Philippines TaxID=1448308 RepID=A0A2T2P4Y9_CORCC|nr:BRCT domain-containing protein [Corynespora cassiicola Philippines]